MIARHLLLAATRAGVVRVTRPEGGSWAAEPALPGHDVCCLAADRTTVYAGTQAGEVHRSNDGGATWARCGLAGVAVKSLAVDGALYAGTREPRVHVSTDRGDSWRPLGGFPRLRSWWWAQPAERPFRPSYVSAVALTSEGIVVGIEACGVFRSIDGGATWSGHRRAALRDCHELLADRGHVYEAGSGGLAASDDGGATWSRRRAGLDRRYGWSVAADANVVYLAAAPYRAAHGAHSRARVFRSRAGRPWEPCTDELSTLPRLRAVEGEVFAALGDGSLIHSRDEGTSWEALPVDLGSASRALLALEPR